MQARKTKKRKKRILYLSICILLVAFAGYSMFLRPRPVPYNQETAKTQDIITHYSFSGNVEPGDEKIVAASSPIRIKTLPIKEGEAVVEDEDIIIPKSGDRIEARLSGILTDIYVEEDETVQSGRNLFRIADYDNPVVSIRVDEYDVGALSTGMEVTVYVHALDKSLTGTISKIDREAKVSGSIAYYDAKVSVPQDGTLRMGMSAEVTVLKDQALSATTVTLNAIQFDDDSKPFVFCYSRGEEIVRQPVILGINNGSIVQVLDGIKSGETVLIPKDNTLSFPQMPAMGNR